MSALETTFEALAAKWQAHIDAHKEASNPFVFIQSEAFEAIVAMGEPVVRLIIAKYREGGPVFWAAALARITGIESFGNGLTGKVEQAREKWIEWFDQKAA